MTRAQENFEATNIDLCVSGAAGRPQGGIGRDFSTRL